MMALRFMVLPIVEPQGPSPAIKRADELLLQVSVSYAYPWEDAMYQVFRS